MRPILPLCLVLALIAPLAAQRTCSSHSHHLHLLSTNAEYAQRQQAIEAQTQQFLAAGSPAAEGVVTIPTVVHVLWNTSTENIPDAQVLAQIQVLNEDFRRMNADAVNTSPAFVSVAADSEIEFCLASVDPQGNPTNGITRTFTSIANFGSSGDPQSASQGGVNAWPSSQYLNIWVCDLGSGLLGYAQLPGGPASGDGIVVTTDAFGRGGSHLAQPFHLGRTATHEVGHWLNLHHIWGDGNCGVDDFVADTPNQNGANYGCAVGTSSCGSVDMAENYMDYSDDSCMNVFTQGQKSRMQALFAPGGARYSLLSSPAACNTGPSGPEYQVNQTAATMILGGQIGSTTSPAITTQCVGAPLSVTHASSLIGQGWNLGLSVANLVPASNGGYVSPGGQVLNLDLSDPFFSLNYAGSFPIFTQSITYSLAPAGPLALSVQQIHLNAGSADGYSLSQPGRLDIGVGGGLTFPAGPSGDDDSVTVSLAQPGACGGTSFNFYGTSYSEFHVSSNGRVTFASPDPSYQASIANALSGQPFVGWWADLDPSSAGTISISSPSANLVRVSWSNVPHYGETTQNSFGVEFDLGNHSVALDGLAGIQAHPAGIWSGAGPDQFLGISRGAPLATDPGSRNWFPGASSGSPGGSAMLYDDYDTNGSSGIVPALQNGVGRIVFTPVGSNYAWVCF